MKRDGKEPPTKQPDPENMTFWQLARLKAPPNRKPRTKSRVAGPEASPVYHPLYRALIFPSTPFAPLIPFLTAAFYRNRFTAQSFPELDAFVKLIGPANTRRLHGLQLTPSFFAATGLPPLEMVTDLRTNHRLPPALVRLDDARPFFAGVAAQLFRTPAEYDVRTVRGRAAPWQHQAAMARRALVLTQLAALPALRSVLLTYAGEVRMVVPRADDDRGTATRPWSELRDLRAPDAPAQLRAFLDLAFVAELGAAVPTLEAIGVQIPVGRASEHGSGTDKSWVVVSALRGCTHRPKTRKRRAEPERAAQRVTTVPDGVEQVAECMGGWCQVRVELKTQQVTRRLPLLPNRLVNLKPGCECRRCRNDWPSCSLEALSKGRGPVAHAE